jgi:hypothetical protein
MYNFTDNNSNNSNFNTDLDFAKEIINSTGEQVISFNDAKLLEQLVGLGDILYKLAAKRNGITVTCLINIQEQRNRALKADIQKGGGKLLVSEATQKRIFESGKTLSKIQTNLSDDAQNLDRSLATLKNKVLQGEPGAALAAQLEGLAQLLQFLQLLQDLEYGILTRKVNVCRVGYCLVYSLGPSAATILPAQHLQLGQEFFAKSENQLALCKKGHPDYDNYDALRLMKLFLERELKLQAINANLGAVLDKFFNRYKGLIDVVKIVQVITRPCATASFARELTKYVGDNKDKKTQYHTLFDPVQGDLGDVLLALRQCRRLVLKSVESLEPPAILSDEELNALLKSAPESLEWLDDRTLLSLSPISPPSPRSSNEEIFDAIDGINQHGYSLLQLSDEQLDTDRNEKPSEQPKKKLKH